MRKLITLMVALLLVAPLGAAVFYADSIDALGHNGTFTGINIGGRTTTSHISASPAGTGSTTLYIGDENILTSGDTITAAGGWTDDGATVRLTTSSDNVGIGTANPGAKLQVHDATGNSTLRISNLASGTTAKLFVGYDNGAAVQQGLEIYRTYGNAAITLQNNQNNHLLLNPSGGNVGIGTANPSYLLDISSATARLLSSSSSYTAWFVANTGTGNAVNYFDAINGDFAGGDYGYVGQTNTGYMEYNIGASSPAPYHVFSGGNVGIGTTGPEAPLHVAGAGTLRVGPTSVGTDSIAGIYFSGTPSSTSDYSIHRTTGAWTGPNYQQLLLDWDTGIILNPGAGAYGKSHVGIVGGLSIGDSYYTTEYNNGLIVQGNVGIGTTNPITSKLHIYDGDAGAISPYVASGLTIEDSSHAVLQFLTPVANEQYIFFGAPHASGATSARAYLMYGHATDTMTYHTGAYHSFSGGNVGIGDSSPTNMLDVTGAIGISDTTVIDASRNLVNIGTINTGQGATEVHLMNQNVQTSDTPTFGQLTLSQTTGTAPLTVNSTTVVNNLNADLLDGQSGAYYLDNTVLLEEEVEDYVGGMVSGNTETGITVTYQDGDGTIDFIAADTDPTNEIQTLGTSGSTITLTGSTSVTAPYSTYSGYANTLYREDNRIISPSELTTGHMKFGFTEWDNANNGGPYADFLHFRGYTDASGGQDNLLMLRKDGTIGMRLWTQTYGSATAYASYKDVALETNAVTFATVDTGSGAKELGDAAIINGDTNSIPTNDQVYDFVTGLGYASGDITGITTGIGTCASGDCDLRNYDGTGSGLDADLLDSQSGAYYLDNTDSQTLSYDAGTDVISISGGNSIDISEVDTNTQLSEAQVEGYIFDADNTGSMTTTGTLSASGAGTHSFGGTLDPTNVAAFTLTGQITGNDQTISDLNTLGVNTIQDDEDGTVSVNDNLDVSGMIHAGDTHYNVLNIESSATPTNGYLISTNIPYTSGSQMPIIQIEGYAYGAGEPILINIVWYIYNGDFVNYAYTNHGAWDPGTISLAQSATGKVTIHLSTSTYYTRMNIRAFETMSGQDAWFEGWSWSDATSPATNKVTVARKEIETSITGNAATATALAADGSNCGAGQAAAGVDSSGNAQGCTTYLQTEVDGSTSNEIQTLGTSGNTITLSLSGGSVTAPYATSAGDANTLDSIDSASFLRSDAADTYTGSELQYNVVAGRTINTATGAQSPLELYQSTVGTDAFMSFHVGGDYAVYFGLDGTTNDLSVGGWSMGANKYKVWHAGNDGASSTLDADLLDGLNSATAATASTIAARDGSGDITQRYGHGQYFSMSHAAATRSSDTVFYSSTDNYIRKTDATGMRASLNVPTRTGGDASGTWGISITGNANTLDSIDSASFLRSDVDDSLTAAIVVPTGNRDEGVFGTYDPLKTQHIWSMGTAYRNSPTGVNFGNLYGLAYMHPNSGLGTYAAGHQMVWAQNGNPTSAMGTNIWTSGTMTSANVNTGPGATEVHLMNQNVQTTDNVVFNDVTSNGLIYAENGIETGDSGTDSGLTAQYSYRYGYQEGGAWASPFPDLVLGYHTGVSIGGHYSYGGTRFFNDHPSRTSTVIMSVGDGDNNVDVKYDLDVQGGDLTLGATGSIDDGTRDRIAFASGNIVLTVG